MNSGRTTIDGIDYYYEVHGQGEPLLILHGGLGSIETHGPGPMMPVLTKGRQVIAVDLQGHGRTTLGSRPIRCEAIADDLSTLLGQLGHAHVDALGYSFGASVALRLAIQRPERVRRLAIVSTTFSDGGWYPDIRAQQKQIGAAMLPFMAQTPIYTQYKAVAPNVDDFPRLLDAMGDYMRQPYDWSSEVARLTMPVMLVFGDADSILPEHEMAFYKLLGGGLRDAGWNREHMPKSRLAIIPGHTHYDGFSKRMVDTVLAFLDAAS
jgi:pimeloyl-ACP methyl ester carboxylesterase